MSRRIIEYEDYIEISPKPPSVIVQAKVHVPNEVPKVNTVKPFSTSYLVKAQPRVDIVKPVSTPQVVNAQPKVNTVKPFSTSHLVKAQPKVNTVKPVSTPQVVNAQPKVNTVKPFSTSHLVKAQPRVDIVKPVSTPQVVKAQPKEVPKAFRLSQVISDQQPKVQVKPVVAKVVPTVVAKVQVKPVVAKVVPKVEIGKPQSPFSVSQLPKFHQKIEVEKQVPIEVLRSNKKFSVSDLPKYETRIIVEPEPEKTITEPPKIGITPPEGSIHVLNVPKYEIPHSEFQPIVNTQKLGLSLPSGPINVLNVPKYEIPHSEFQPIVNTQKLGLSLPSGPINVLNVPLEHISVGDENPQVMIPEQKVGLRMPSGKIQILKVPNRQLKRLTTQHPRDQNKLRAVSSKSFSISDLPVFHHPLEKQDDSDKFQQITTPKFKIPTFVKNKEVNESGELLDVNVASISYNSPTRNDMAVLLVFFDYVGSVRILMNYLFMREKLKLANIPVFTIELVLHDHAPKINDSIRVYGSSYLFQKENLFRLLEKHIPAWYTKLVFLDADVLFDDQMWYDNLSILLDSKNIVQCFSDALWLNIEYTRIQKKAVPVIDFDPKILKGFWNHDIVYHPGFAWAFTRSWYNQIGFYDLAIIGSGDTIFSQALFDFKMLDRKNQEYRLYNDIDEWWKPSEWSSGKLPGKLYHLYHGSLQKRQYTSRYEKFNSYSNIHEISMKNEDGVYELTYPELNEAMKEFFKTRDDDGID